MASGVSSKTQYALRTVFELAKHRGNGAITLSQIAASQAIPPRFLELIIQQLRQAGFVESRRGNQGGYFLAKAPEKITAADIIRQMDGSLDPVKCIMGMDEKDCPLRGRCAFIGLWNRAKEALEGVYETTTIQDLLDAEANREEPSLPDYSI